MSSPQNIDSIYYRDNKNGMSLIVRARNSMFDLFIKEFIPNKNTRIIDIGVSDEENEGSNFLEKNYNWPENITCAGLGTGDMLKKSYPSVKFVQIAPNKPLPFQDFEFDIACSNAVLEHVGGEEQRRFFISEHLRIAKSVFITVPNRWFPVEHHTSLPLLHFNPWLFRALLRPTKYKEWTDLSTLDFIGKSEIIREWPGNKRPTLKMTGISLGPFSSNIAIINKND